jgi:hypothetical protein
MSPWTVVGKFTPAGARLADGHYSRRTPGSPQFMPPGQTLVLLTPDCRAVFGWWRPDPRSGIVYVWDAKVASRNPGYCFKVAGWKAIGRSADGKKTLLHKPAELAGQTPLRAAA